MAADSALANSSFNSIDGAAGVLNCTDICSSIRPRPTRFCSSPRTRGSTSASDCGIRSCRSRNRWFTARRVTPIVARSSSCVSEAYPVIDLIIGLRSRSTVVSYALRLVGGLFLKLQFVKSRIRAATREQFLVATRFDDPAALQDDNRVGTPNSGQPMSDDKRGPVEHQRRQCIL